MPRKTKHLIALGPSAPVVLQKGHPLHIQGFRLTLEADAGGPKRVNLGPCCGMILALVTRIDEIDHFYGSAVLVAPGVAMGAYHVFEETRSALLAGRGSLAAIGLGDQAGQFWFVKHVKRVVGTDLGIFLLEYVGAADQLQHLQLAYLRIGSPKAGDRVVSVGVCPRAPDGRTRSEDPIEFDAKVVIGRVIEVHPRGRDRSMLPWPCFAFEGGLVGAMSGGGVFDEDGCLIGINCSSYTGDDPVSYASLIWPACVARLPAPDPPFHGIGEDTYLGMARRGWGFYLADSAIAYRKDDSVYVDTDRLIVDAAVGVSPSVDLLDGKLEPLAERLTTIHSESELEERESLVVMASSPDGRPLLVVHGEGNIFFADGMSRLVGGRSSVELWPRVSARGITWHHPDPAA